MANHKYKNTSNQRAGCKLCKPWKINGNRNNGYTPKRPISDLRALQYDTASGVDEYYEDQGEYIGCTPETEWVDNVLPWLIEYNVR